MAKPIRETPVLEGKDASIFITKMNDAESQKISEKEKERMRTNYVLVNSIVKK